jgi:hypothetical protein
MWYRKVLSFGGGVDFTRNQTAEDPDSGIKTTNLFTLTSTTLSEGMNF